MGEPKGKVTHVCGSLLRGRFGALRVGHSPWVACGSLGLDEEWAAPVGALKLGGVAARLVSDYSAESQGTPDYSAEDSRGT